MGLLIKNSQVSERARGLRFVEKFESTAETTLNDQVIVNAPVINNGCTFVGASSQKVYTTGYSFAGKSKFSIRIKFTTGADVTTSQRIIYQDVNAGGSSSYVVSAFITSGNLWFLVNTSAALSLRETSVSGGFRRTCASAIFKLIFNRLSLYCLKCLIIFISPNSNLIYCLRLSTAQQGSLNILASILSPPGQTAKVLNDFCLVKGFRPLWLLTPAFLSL